VIPQANPPAIEASQNRVASHASPISRGYSPKSKEPAIRIRRCPIRLERKPNPNEANIMVV